MNQIPVTVTGAGSLFGQGIIKCLLRSDFPLRVHGLDYFTNAVGLRWCAKAGVLPDILDPAVSDTIWFDALCRQVEAADSRILFVGADFELIPLAERSAILFERTGCTAVVSAPNTVKICKDKYQTARHLGGHGIAVPASFLPDADLNDIERALGYPVIVKPRFGSRSRGVARADDRRALERELAEVDRPVIQQWLQGDDQEFTCGVVVLDGTVDTVSVLRRRLRDGNTVSAVSERNAAIEALCIRCAEILAPFGPLNIQLRLVDGVPHVFEINPRFSGTTVFRALLGINEPERVLRHMLGLPLDRAPELQCGRITRYFEELVEFDSHADAPEATTMVSR